MGGSMESQVKKEGVTILEKGKKGVIHMIFSRFGIVLFLLLVQAVVAVQVQFLVV